MKISIVLIWFLFISLFVVVRQALFNNIWSQLSKNVIFRNMEWNVLWTQETTASFPSQQDLVSKNERAILQVQQNCYNSKMENIPYPRPSGLYLLHSEWIQFYKKERNHQKTSSWELHVYQLIEFNSISLQRSVDIHELQSLHTVMFGSNTVCSLSLLKVTLLVFADDGEVCLQESARGHLWPVRPWREWDNESGGVQLVQPPDEWWGGRRWWVGGGGGYVGYSSSWKNIDSLLLCLIITIYKSTFTGNEDFDFLL